MNEQLPKTITDLLRGLDHTDDDNKTYILAASFNLYLEAMRRIHGRALLHPGDIRSVLDMAYTMIVNPPTVEKSFEPTTARDRKLTNVEEEHLMNAIAPSPATTARRV